MYHGERDLDHAAVADSFRVVTKRDGNLLLNRCERCKGFIWRTAGAPWSHSQPSRYQRDAQPHDTDGRNVTLVGHLTEAGIAEAAAHGHPEWSHLYAFGPCTITSEVNP